MNKLMLALIFCNVLHSQSDSISEFRNNDSLPMQNELINREAISGFYVKLNELQQGKRSKVNVVHIGDSHIQADLMTNVTRVDLQKIFGNGGRGFVFPHSLAKTNGSSDIRFSSDANWQSLRNIYQPGEIQVGLSGIGLQTSASDFTIELKLKDPATHFNTIRIITPDNRPCFTVALEKHLIVTESEIPKQVSHRIKKGDVLSEIAAKYNTSVQEIKRVNKLKSNMIQAGKTLIIPASGTEKPRSEKFTYVPLPLVFDPLANYYHSTQALDKIAIVPLPGQLYNLNGLILSNDSPGILYHSIGVNGAKFSDYNKYLMFFDQLNTLEPDLLVVSLGTNESFDKMSEADYGIQLDLFLQTIRSRYPDLAIVIATPPPSLFNRKTRNEFVSDYAKCILRKSVTGNFAVWDLYTLLGGHEGIPENSRNGILGGDRVHYTKAGYELQGKMFAEALIKGLFPN